MATLEFDGHAHLLSFRNWEYKVVATAHANNRTDSSATLRFVNNGHYPFADRHVPHRHGAQRDTKFAQLPADSLQGEYGTHGIFRFTVPGHSGVGVHAGRFGVPDRTMQKATGPDHVTMGCIRTTEEMMAKIINLIRMDPLEFLYVTYNRRQR